MVPSGGEAKYLWDRPFTFLLILFQSNLTDRSLLHVLYISLGQDMKMKSFTRYSMQNSHLP